MSHEKKATRREREMKISYHSSLTLYVCSAVVLLYDTVWTVKYVPKACSANYFWLVVLIEYIVFLYNQQILCCVYDF